MSPEDESVQIDSYLDALLAGRPLGPQPVVSLVEESAQQVDSAAVDDGTAPAELQAAATLVQRALPRFHPSFAFEEGLARRLRTPVIPSASNPVSAFSAAATSEPEPVPPSVILPFPPRPAKPAPTEAGSDRRARGVLLGSAIASGVSLAGVSLAGAALLARRRSRSPVSLP